MGIDRESEEDIEMNEKSFEIGQRVRIIGPTAADTNIHTGKYFVIEEAKGVPWKNGPFQYCVGYSKHGSIHAWPASSLELADPESDRLDAIEQRLDSIEKRLQPPEGKANNDTSDELPKLHVGDYVEVVERPFGVSGLPVGTIDRVSYQAPFGWFTLEGSEAWYPLRSLRKLSDKEIIAKIGWERKA